MNANQVNGDFVASPVDGSKIIMRPFMNIGEETYNTYFALKT